MKKESFCIDSLFCQEHAGLGVRLWAALLDYLFLSLVLKVMRMVFSTAPVNQGLLVFVVVSYLVITTGISGQTLGKWALGLKVVDEDGMPPGLLRATLRTLGYVVSLPFFMGFLWIRIDSECRGWHDFIAGTKVILV